MTFWKRKHNLTFGTATDRGLVRTENQDRCGIFEIGKSTRATGGKAYLMVVADGMGGHIGGAIAAETAVEALRNNLESFKGEPRTRIAEAGKAAYNGLVERITENPELGNMGTTLSAVIYRSGKAYPFHIGDSRIYLADRKGIRQLSQDHSLANELLKSGAISVEQASNHPDRNILMRALCGSVYMEPDIYEPINVKSGDILLICSDGLWNMVSDNDLHKIITRDEPQKAAEALISQANLNGGSDNIAAVLMRASE